MAFDAESDLPLIDPHKRTTRVNIWMGVWVAIFFAFGLAAILWYFHRHPHHEAPPPERQASQG